MVTAAATFSETIWLATLTALVTSLASSRISRETGCPSMPSGWAALNVLMATFSNELLVSVPKAAVAPDRGVETASLMGPAGMGGYFEAAAVVPDVPLAVLFLDELPQ